MADLSVKVCGVEFNNPLIAASGTFGFGMEYSELYPLEKLGGISCKGITLTRRDGNPVPRVAETPSGILNAVGLQNPGVDVFINEDLPWLKKQNTVIIANIAGNTPEDYCAMAEKLSETDVDMIELNISCPNVKSGGVQFGTSCESVGAITAAVKKYCKKPLIVKLSPNVTDIASIAQAAEANGADAISMINTLTGMRIDRLFEYIISCNDSANRRIRTGMLNELLAQATTRVQPPSDKGKRLKIFYMTQASVKPPTFVFFCNNAQLFHFSYQRYLENRIREAFALEGTPIKIVVRERGEK